MISGRELFAEISNESVSEGGDVVGYFVKSCRMGLLEQLLAAREAVSASRKLFTCSACGAEGLDEPLESKCHCCIDGAEWVESLLYAAPPAPALPVQHWEELCRQHPNMSIGDAIIRAAWWNHCREKLLENGNYPEIPDGWRVSPVDATWEMIEAAWRSSGDDTDYGAVYRAMMAAAPDINKEDGQQ